MAEDGGMEVFTCPRRGWVGMGGSAEGGGGGFGRGKERELEVDGWEERSGETKA